VRALDEAVFDRARLVLGALGAALLSPAGLRPLLLDVGGTLLEPAEPVDRVYLRLGRPFGVRSVDFRAAWRGRDPRIQQTGDGRPFWRALVEQATGCDDPSYFELLYATYQRAEAWSVAAGARELLEAHPRVALVSNWDTRLRPTIQALGLPVAGIACSGELGVEKPDPALFLEGCRLLGCSPAEALHVGDSEREDLLGARAAGIEAWLWGRDVNDFRVLRRALGG
jgi:REG-2-like HAD superfamily hydrolase